MDYHLKPVDGKKERISLTLVLLGFFLNQSGSIFGLNISITDFFFLVTFMNLIFTHGIVIKPIFILFFISISVVGLYTSLFYSPLIFPVAPSGYSVLTNFLKFVVVFLYMVLGYNAARLKYDQLIIRAFSFGGVLVGLLGIILTLTNSGLFNDLFFYELVRFKGLMNDPNYFAVIQVAVIACIVNNRYLSKVIRSILCISVIISILVSGSKTGFITLFIYFLYKILENLIRGENKVFSLVVLCATAIMLLLNPFSYISLLVTKLSASIPILYRISNLLNNPFEAASSGGSGRTGIWIESINIIEKSPILGVGFGTFTDIMQVFRGSSELAHNTYIQIIAEWGILLSSFSMLYITVMLITSFFIKNATVESQTIKDIVIVLLIGSLGISLNNSRLLWFFIGILVFYSTSNFGRKSKEMEVGG